MKKIYSKESLEFFFSELKARYGSHDTWKMVYAPCKHLEDEVNEFYHLFHLIIGNKSYKATRTILRIATSQFGSDTSKLHCLARAAALNTGFAK